MRYSPYEMSDYGLQHQGGSVTPITAEVYNEAEWNLHWASIPELDGYLNLPYEDFDAFRSMTQEFPFLRKGQVEALLNACPPLRTALETGTPAQASELLQANHGTVKTIFGETTRSWLATVMARLEMAQSMFNMGDAADLCKSIVVVDFKAQKRL